MREIQFKIVISIESYNQKVTMNFKLFSVFIVVLFLGMTFAGVVPSEGKFSLGDTTVYFRLNILSHFYQKLDQNHIYHVQRSKRDRLDVMICADRHIHVVVIVTNLTSVYAEAIAFKRTQQLLKLHQWPANSLINV